MKLNSYRFFLFSLISLFAGSISIFSQAPFNFLPVLFFSFPFLFLILGAENFKDSFLKRSVRFVYFGSIFLYGYFFFGLSWIGSAFSYKLEFEGLKFLSIFGLPLLLVLLSSPGWLITALFWGPRLQSCFAIAFGVIVGEYSRSILLTGFPWILFGHSLSFDDRAMQISSIVGAHSASLIVVLFSLTPILLINKKTIFPGLITASILPLLIFYGSTRIPDSLNFSEKSFLLVQPNISQDVKLSRDSFQLSMDKLINLSSKNQNADLIIWPESALPVLLSQDDQIRKHIMESIGGGSSLLTGNIRIDENGDYKNSSFLIHENGKIISSYDKVHLVPFGEYLPFSGIIKKFNFLKVISSDNGFSKGLSFDPISTPIGLARILICYEIIFSKEISWSDSRPEVLINITNDAWFDKFSGPYQHFENARFRAIEYGLPVLRSANTGISAVIGPYGRVLSKIKLGEEGAIYSLLPQRITNTFFSKFGDFTLLILIILCCICFRKNLMREYFNDKK